MADGGRGAGAAAAPPAPRAGDLSLAWRETILHSARTSYHGTASIESKDGAMWLCVSATAEVERLISRLAMGYCCEMPVRLQATRENARLVRMVASEYPLEMATPDLWASIYEQIAADDRRAAAMSRLEPVDPPATAFNGRLLPHQREALDYMNKSDGCCILGDDMGLGKTVETLAYLAGKPGAYPVAVVAPLVTLTHWRREIEKFLRVCGTTSRNTLDGVGGEGGGEGGDEGKNAARPPIVQVLRGGARMRLKPADFYIVNYDIIHRRARDLLDAGIRTVIFDEVQALRRNDSMRYSACRNLALSQRIRHRLGLSGTPVYNNRLELHSIAEVIRPGALGTRMEFAQRWPTRSLLVDDDDGGGGGGGNEEAGHAAEKERADLATMLHGKIMLRRRKEDVLDLPEKTRMNQEINIDREYYCREMDGLLASIGAECARLEGVADGGGGGAEGLKEEDDSGAGAAGVGLHELHQRLNEMRTAERQIAGVSKAGHVGRYLKSMLSEYTADKFVVFVHHKAVRGIIRRELAAYNPAEIVGGQLAGRRQGEIDRFQSDAKCRVMIAGLRSGNVGISLTAASYVIFAELDWSPSVHRQAEDRLHRLGQKRPVFAHYLIGLGTFDETIAKTLARKTLDISGIMGEAAARVDNAAALRFLAKRYGRGGAGAVGRRGGAGAVRARYAGVTGTDIAGHCKNLIADIDRLVDRYRSERKGGGG